VIHLEAVRAELCVDLEDLSTLKKKEAATKRAASYLRNDDARKTHRNNQGRARSPKPDAASPQSLCLPQRRSTANPERNPTHCITCQSNGTRKPSGWCFVVRLFLKQSACQFLENRRSGNTAYVRSQKISML